MSLPLDDVTRLPGPEKRDCPCPYCAENPPAAFGTPRKKAWADGLHHVKGCGCRRCEGSRHKRRAAVRERRMARESAGTRQPLSGALSGYDVGSGLFRIEETENKALVRGLFSWWDSKQTVEKTARLMALTGVRRAYVCHQDGRSLAVMPWEDLADLMREQAS